MESNVASQHMKSLLPLHPSYDTFYCLERSKDWVQVVRRQAKTWQVTNPKQVLACVLRRRSPFDCYVEHLLKRWAEIGIRVSERDKQRAEETPHRRISRTKVEIYTDSPVATWNPRDVHGLSDRALLEKFLSR
jgi:hypothetical protein